MDFPRSVLIPNCPKADISPGRGQLRGATSQIFFVSARQVLDGTRRGWPSGTTGSSPGLKSPPLILSLLLLLEYQP